MHVFKYEYVHNMSTCIYLGIIIQLKYFNDIPTIKNIFFSFYPQGKLKYI